MSLAQTVNEDALAFLRTSDGIVNTRTLLTNVIVTFLFGVVSTLASFSVYLLCRNGLQAHSRKILFVATTTLYTSTTFYWAINVACMLSFDHFAISAASKIHDSTFSTDTFLTLRRVQERATPTALTVNIFVGDIVVWWRALAAWQGNKNVRCICGICLLAATAGLTLISIVYTSIDGSLEAQPTSLDIVSAFFSGVFGSLSALLSLVTNAAATAMIALRAWHQRRIYKQCFGHQRVRSPAIDVLVTLANSGAVYCAIWTLVVVYAFASTFGHKNLETAARGWYDMYFYLTNGCLIAFVAVYPMVIIVLAALHKAQVARKDELMLGVMGSAGRPAVFAAQPV